MTLGLRCAHVARTPRLKPCRYGCGVQVLTKCAAKACDACHAKHGGAARVDPDRLDPKYLDAQAVDIERTFAAALAEIRRRPRAEPELGWSSPLTRIF